MPATSPTAQAPTLKRVATRWQIVGMLREVARTFESTVLLVTHNPHDAASGDRVLFLHDGDLKVENALTGGDFRAADVFRRLEELGI